MSEIFLKIINMSISATYIVLAVLLLRLLLKKAPKWITVVLWGIVAVRLVCPFSIESVLSLIPSSEVVSPNIMTDKTPTINTGIPIINSALNSVISESFTPNPGDSANPLQIWIPVLTAIWIVGMVALLIYTVISYARVRRKIGTAVLLRDNIYQSENVVSPFVLGLIKPKIYLPFNMNEKDMEHVVAHEMAHIRRKDHLWKPLGFLLLTLHWFNPLMWLGYVLLCRDIELACDEKVIKELDHDARADYSEALLTCSVNRRMIAACPLAFGEVGVKDRVKSVLNYKKPAFWIIIAYRVFITGFSYEHSIFLRLFDIQSLRAVRLLFWVTIILSSCLQIPKASGRLSKMQAGVATFAIFGYSMMYESVSTHIRKILSKIDQAFDELNKMCDHMEKYQKFTYIKHTSPLVRGLQYDNSQSGSSDEKSMAYGFLCSLDENPRFNCLHSHKRLESIKNACKPWDDFLPRLARGFSLLSAYEKSHHESDG